MEVSVRENVTIGRFLGRLHATDPDEGGNTKVTYSIDRSTDRKRQFRIDKEGTITVQRKLDREKSTRHEVVLFFKFLLFVLYFSIYIILLVFIRFVNRVQLYCELNYL